MLETKSLEELNGVEIYEEFLGETDPFNSDKPHPKNHVAYGYGACVATIGEDNKIADLHVAYDGRSCSSTHNPVLVKLKAALSWVWALL